MVSKYKSPTSNDELGADDATLYLSAKLFTPVTFDATVFTLDIEPATVLTFEMLPAVVFTF